MTQEEIFRLKTEVIEGKHVNLRIATTEDAEFILSLRLNPILNQFIGKTDPSVEIQKKWITESYQKISDFHFIIEDKNKKPHGTIAVYNIDFENRVAEWGRWIVMQGSLPYFAVESTILAFYFGLRKLGLKKLVGGANNKNKRVISFHKTYASISSSDEDHTWFFVEERNYLKILGIYEEFLDSKFS